MTHFVYGCFILFVVSHVMVGNLDRIFYCGTIKSYGSHSEVYSFVISY
jgi:hypothetical protein